MACISIGTVNKNLYSIFIGCIFSFLSRLLYNYKEAKLFKHSIITNYVSAFSRILTFIPLIIFKLRSRRIKSSSVEKAQVKGEVKLIYKNASLDIIKGKWKYIFLTSGIFYVQGILLVYTIDIKTNFWIMDILITLIFYYLIFKIKLYMHHYLSIIIMILTGLIIDLAFQNLQNDLTTRLPLFLLRFLRETLYSLHDVVNKYAMERKFCSVYEICFYNGLIGIVLLSIFSLFDYYYIHMDNFMEYLDDFNTKELLINLAYIVTQLGLYLFSLITNRNTSPCHIFIIYVFGQLGYYVDFSELTIIFIICVIFILFLSLIFTEIIEINCFGLSRNTKRNIRLRAHSDNVDVFIIDNNDTFEENEENDGNEDIKSSRTIELKESHEPKE